MAALNQLNQMDEQRPMVFLRTLPTQTTAAFYLIVLVFMGVLLGSVGGGSPICMWPVVLSLLILPVRAVLATPRRELAVQQDKEAIAELQANGEYGRVQKVITEMAAQVGHHRPVKLIVSRHPKQVRAFGSWRRHYLLLSRDMVSKVAADLESADKRPLAEALLLHEMAHIVHKDVQRISYTRALFRSCVTVLPWWMFLLIAWLMLALLSGQAILDFDPNTIADPTVRELLAPIVELSPAQRAEIAKDVAEVSPGLLLSYIIFSFWPLIVVGFTLWLFVWRQMLRMQEHYADHLAVSEVGDSGAILAAIGRYRTWFRLREAPTTTGWRARIAKWGQQWQQAGYIFMRQIPFINKLLTGLWRWFSLHPTYQERVAFALNPAELYQDWRRAAIPAAFLTLALDVMLITPFFAYHVAGYPVHFSTLAIFLLLTTWLVPFIVHQQSFLRPLAYSLLLIFGFRWIWLAGNILLLVAIVLLTPGTALEIMNLIVTTTAGFTGYLETLPVTDPLAMMLLVVPVVLGAQVLQALVMLGLLTFYVRWQRGVLNRPGVNWSRRHWWGILGMSIAATTLALTPLSDLLNGELTPLISPVRILTYALGLLCLAALLLANFRVGPEPAIEPPSFATEEDGHAKL